MDLSLLVLLELHNRYIIYVVLVGGFMYTVKRARIRVLVIMSIT